MKLSDPDLRPLEMAAQEWSKAQLSREADARIRARLTAVKRRPPILGFALAMGAGLAIGLSMVALRPAPAPLEPRATDGIAIEERACSLEKQGDVLVGMGRCSLDVPDHRLSIE